MSRTSIQIETSRLALLGELDQQKSASERNRWGQFATPPPLADQIVRTALQLLPKRGKIRYLEPGFGTGAFLSALRLATSRLGFAKAIELDPLFVDNARNLWKGTGLRIVEGDFTELSPPISESAKFDLVVSNPPYVRHHHIDRAKKKSLQRLIADRMGIQISGLAGLYAHFMLLSQQWMKQGGIGAWLVPAEFMDVNYGDAIRAFLVDRVALSRIHRFDPSEVQFDNALVSSVAVFFKNERPRLGHQVEFTTGGTVQRPRTNRRLPIASLADSGKWTAVAKANVRRSSGTVLSELFTIKRGVATGCNRFFVLDEVQVQDFKLPLSFLQPILPSPRLLDRNIVTARRDGSPDIENRRFLLSCSLSRPQIKRRSISLHKYLEHGESSGVHEGYLCRNRQPWYQQERRQPPWFLCTYMGRASDDRQSPFRFIWNQSNAIAANVYLMLYPKPDIEERVRDDGNVQENLFRCLQSICVESLVGEGRVYGGGLHKVEPKELAKVHLDLH